MSSTSLTTPSLTKGSSVFSAEEVTSVPLKEERDTEEETTNLTSYAENTADEKVGALSDSLKSKDDSLECKSCLGQNQRDCSACKKLRPSSEGVEEGLRNTGEAFNPKTVTITSGFTFEAPIMACNASATKNRPGFYFGTSTEKCAASSAFNFDTTTSASASTMGSSPVGGFKFPTDAVKFNFGSKKQSNTTTVTTIGTTLPKPSASAATTGSSTTAFDIQPSTPMTSGKEYREILSSILTVNEPEMETMKTSALEQTLQEVSLNQTPVSLNSNGNKTTSNIDEKNLNGVANIVDARSATHVETHSSPLAAKDGYFFFLASNDVIDLFGLQCDICKQLYDLQSRSPKLLLCKHTVCLCCLEKIKESELKKHDAQSNEFTILCPTCSNCIDEKTIESLPNDKQVMKGWDVLKKATIGSEVMCTADQCQSRDFYCKTCASMVCLWCVTTYHKKLDGHNILSLGEAFEDNANHFDKMERKCRKTLDWMKTREILFSNIKCNLYTMEREVIDKVKEMFDGSSLDEWISMVKRKVLKTRTKINSECCRPNIKELQELYNQFTVSRLYRDSRQTFKFYKKLRELYRIGFDFPSVEMFCRTFEFKATIGGSDETYGDLEYRIQPDLMLDPHVYNQHHSTQQSPFNSC